MTILRDNMLFLVSSVLLALLIGGSSALQQQYENQANAAPATAQTVATAATVPQNPVRVAAPEQSGGQLVSTTPPAPSVKPSIRGGNFDDEGSDD